MIEAGRNNLIVRYLHRIGDLAAAGAYAFPGPTWAILRELTTYANVRGGDIRPSTLTLARRTGFDRRTVYRALAALRVDGLIIETQRLNARTPVQYRLGEAITEPHMTLCHPNKYIRENGPFASFAPEKMRGGLRMTQRLNAQGEIEEVLTEDQVKILTDRICEDEAQGERLNTPYNFVPHSNIRSIARRLKQVYKGQLKGAFVTPEAAAFAKQVFEPQVETASVSAFAPLVQPDADDQLLLP